MLLIPQDVLAQFDAALKQRNVPAAARADYRKWLWYFLDFRARYPLPGSKAEQVRLFLPQESLTFVAETKQWRRYHLHDSHVQDALIKRSGRQNLPSASLPIRSGIPTPLISCKQVTTFTRSRSSWVTPMSGQP